MLPPAGKDIDPFIPVMFGMVPLPKSPGRVLFPNPSGGTIVPLPNPPDGKEELPPAIAGIELLSALPVAGVLDVSPVPAVVSVLPVHPAISTTDSTSKAASVKPNLPVIVNH
jgi:hypothetical protein